MHPALPSVHSLPPSGSHTPGKNRFYFPVLQFLNCMLFIQGGIALVFLTCIYCTCLNNPFYSLLFPYCPAPLLCNTLHWIWLYDLQTNARLGTLLERMGSRDNCWLEPSSLQYQRDEPTNYSGELTAFNPHGYHTALISSLNWWAIGDLFVMLYLCLYDTVYSPFFSWCNFIISDVTLCSLTHAYLILLQGERLGSNFNLL
jgi:hypothetical protein